MDIKAVGMHIQGLTAVRPSPRGVRHLCATRLRNWLGNGAKRHITVDQCAGGEEHEVVCAGPEVNSGMAQWSPVVAKYSKVTSEVLVRPYQWHR